MKYILDEEEYNGLCERVEIQSAVDEFLAFLEKKSRISNAVDLEAGPDSRLMTVTFNIQISELRAAIKKLKDVLSPWEPPKRFSG